MSWGKPWVKPPRQFPSVIPPEHRRNASMVSLSGQFSASIAKTEPVRSEAYRRLVAAMPCANCGRVGHSQHAHTNAGKAKGMKNDDRDAMPLCADDYGLLGCHSRFDRYAMFLDRAEHVRMGAQWADETRQKIDNMGLWPAKLPRWTE